MRKKRCASCVWYMKMGLSQAKSISVGRCRKKAPSFDGFPTVFSVDWCGEFRLDSHKVDDYFKKKEAV